MISTAERLSRLETKIEKRKAAIAEETKKLNADLAEYDKLCLLALADKFKLKARQQHLLFHENMIEYKYEDTKINRKTFTSHRSEKDEIWKYQA